MNKVEIPFSFYERRPGDVFSSFAQVSKAKRILNWKTKRNLKLMCKDSWRWQKKNPNGYGKKL